MSKIWQKHGFDRSQPYPKNLKKKKKKKRHESIGSLRGDSGTWGGGGLHCMTSVHSVHTNNGEGEFVFAPKYIIWDPGGSKKQTDAIVESGMGFRIG